MIDRAPVQQAEAGARAEPEITSHTAEAPHNGGMGGRRWQPWGRRGQSLMRTLRPFEGQLGWLPWLVCFRR